VSESKDKIEELEELLKTEQRRFWNKQEQLIEAFGGIHKLPNFQKLCEEDGWYVWISHPKQYGEKLYTRYLHLYEDDWWEKNGGLLMKRYPQFNLDTDEWGECDCGDWGEMRDIVLSKLGIEG
jgi:hypothetical protein